MNFKLSILTILFVQFLLGCDSATEQKDVRPNIILFLVDDMGWQDTSVPFWNQETDFNRLYRTPNMERLAAEGMKFTQAYATPVCSPTRVSLMTGMNAARHRVTNWTLRKDKTHGMETNHKELIFPQWNVNGLSMDVTTERAVIATPLPEVLRKAGYFTMHVGKAHFGAIDTPGENPLNLGFEKNIAGHAAGAPKSYLGEQNYGNLPKFEGQPWPVPGLEKYHGDSVFLTEALTLEAISTLDSAGTDKPFFLYMAHYAVHTPIMADQRFLQNYDTAMHPTEAAYATMVEGMDKSLGDIMNYLEEKGIADNTIILFMSDNGGLSAVARGGERHTHNLPLSSGKGSMREGGIREPMLVKWPGITQPGSENNGYLIIEDFYPTILEMAGVENPDIVQEIDGLSFSDLLKGGGNDYDRPLVWHYPNEWGPSGPGIGAASTIRKGDWKLIYYHKDQSFELFNIKEDIGEMNNLVVTNPEKVEELALILTSELKGRDAQMTSLKATGEQIPWPDEVVVNQQDQE